MKPSRYITREIEKQQNRAPRRPGWLMKKKANVGIGAGIGGTSQSACQPPGLKLAAKYGRGPRFRGRPETGSTTNRRPEGQQAGRCAGASPRPNQHAFHFFGTRFVTVAASNYTLNQNAYLCLQESSHDGLSMVNQSRFSHMALKNCPPTFEQISICHFDRAWKSINAPPQMDKRPKAIRHLVCLRWHLTFGRPFAWAGCAKRVMLG